MSKASVLLQFDGTAFAAVIDELGSAFEALVQPGDGRAELLGALGDSLLNFVDSGRAFGLERLPASAAGECRVSLKPSETLLLGLAAMRAGNIDLCLEIYGHDKSSIGLVGTSDGRRVGEGES